MLLLSNRQFDDGAAAKEPTELFTKNIGLYDRPKVAKFLVW